MKIKGAVFLVLLGCLLLSSACCPVGGGVSGGIVVPTVGYVPQGWYQSGQSPYGTFQEVDGTKWGVVEYTDSDDYDMVQIYYGDVPPELQGKESDATALIGRAVLESVTFTPEETGTITVAGHIAGYAKAYDELYDVYDMEIVFVDGATCIDIYAIFDATAGDESQVMALINSIDL